MLRHYLYLTFMSLLCVSCSSTVDVKSEYALPNIVIFIVDDLGSMDSSLPFLSRNGKAEKYPLNEWYRTPNLEAFAHQAIRFSHFYAHSVCSPSRISLMTGQNSARHKTTNWISPIENNGGELAPANWNWKGLQSGDVTLAKLLQAKGYQTIHIGKAHFAPDKTSGADPVNLGFDVNIAGHAWGAPGSYYGEREYRRKGATNFRALKGVPDLEKYHGTETFLTEALTLEAEQQVDLAVARQKPFYLYLSHYAVHAPFQPDARFAEHYADSNRDKRSKAFATLVEGVDKSFGDLVRHLKQLGVASNTLILFLGDNGSAAPLGDANEIASSAPLRGKKGSQWEGGVRVPFMAGWVEADSNNPWQQRMPIAAGEIQAQVGTISDILPTIDSLVDLTVPVTHKVDGFDLTKRLRGEEDLKAPETFLSHFPHPRDHSYFTTYRKGNWKVIYHYFPELTEVHSHYELYDLSKDISESRNLAADHPIKLKEMMKSLVNALEMSDAQYPAVAGKEVRPILPQ